MGNGRKIFQNLRSDIDLTNKIVHHIDGDQSNNYPGNLVSLTRQEHRYVHIKMGGVRKTNRNQPFNYTIENLESLVNLSNAGIYIYP